MTTAVLMTAPKPPEGGHHGGFSLQPATVGDYDAYQLSVSVTLGPPGSLLTMRSTSAALLPDAVGRTASWAPRPRTSWWQNSAPMDACMDSGPYPSPTRTIRFPARLTGRMPLQWIPTAISSWLTCPMTAPSIAYRNSGARLQRPDLRGSRVANEAGFPPHRGGSAIICSLLQLAVAAAWVAGAAPAVAQADAPMLSRTNPDVPFCYLSGKQRSWPVRQTGFPEDVCVTLTARQGERRLAQGRRLAWPGFKVSLERDGFLTVQSSEEDEARALELDIVVDRPGGKEVQTIVLQPAPPSRPISYYADFGDDIIRMFWNSKTGLFDPIAKSGFDQYFRRLQAHGISRLVVWLGPFSASWFHVEASNCKMTIKRKRAFDVLLFHQHERNTIGEADVLISVFLEKSQCRKFIILVRAKNRQRFGFK